MRCLTLVSPAKLNLYLKIIRRRLDGYHELVTLFHRISLHDKICLKKKQQGYSLTADSASRLPVGENNLVTRAYRLLEKHFKGIGGVAVHLEKNIPIGGGLGGGSSDAATFLLGMKEIFDLQISKKDLVRLGAQLGADVPFFLYEVNQAIAKGIGEKIESRPTKVCQYFLLLISKQGVSTKQIYQNFTLHQRPVSLTKTGRLVKLLADLLEKRNFDQAAGLLENDLEEPAFRLRPSLRGTLSKLNQLGIRPARMSGSGPTIFAILPRPEEAQGIAQKLQRLLPAQEIVICHSY